MGGRGKYLVTKIIHDDTVGEGVSDMSLITTVKERLFGPEEETRRRYNCRACSTNFNMPESAVDVACPECGEEERVYRL